MRSWLKGLLPLGVAALLLVGCGGGGSDDDGQTAVAPTITSAPSSVTVTEGQTATFSVVAQGEAPLAYQWSRNGSAIAGATGASYTTPAATTADSGATFAVAVSNGAGNVTSPAATLTVTPLPRGTLAGRVLSAATGQPIASATVRVGALSTTTAADGSYTLPAVADARVVATVEAQGHAHSVRVANVLRDRTTALTVALLPVGATQAVSVAAGGDVTVPGSTALVRLPAAGLVRVDGGAAAANVTVSLTPINPAIDINLMPGDYTALAGGNGAVQQIESFGAILVEIRDASGARYNLAAGKSATVRIPLGTRTPAAALEPSVPLWYMNEQTGRWVEEGSAQLRGTAPNQYYEGVVTHFSFWNADQVADTVTVSGCVRDEANQPVANVLVVTDGIDYSGSTSVRSTADGSFVVPMKRGARATVTGLDGLRLTNSVSAGPSDANFSLPACLVVSASSASLNIKLTWGGLPEDVDSHLLLPNGDHVSFMNEGTLLAPTYASLDVDDVDGFGPEIVTATRLYVGTYRYAVHNYSGTFDPAMTASPVRVELNRSGALNLFAPPAGEGVNEVWHVFDLIVDAQCRVTVQPVNSWSSTMPAAIVAPSPTLCTP